MANTSYGRRRPAQDLCPNAFEALKWETPESPIGKAANKKKTIGQMNQILMERSPQKWKTMYRDQYRKFTNSPGKLLGQGGNSGSLENLEEIDPRSQ